jgi:hypothetical protein
MPEPDDPELVSTVISDIVNKVIAEHRQQQGAIFGALLVEILCAGLYTEAEGGGSTFAAGINQQLRRIAQVKGGDPWQLGRIAETALERADEAANLPPATRH